MTNISNQKCQQPVKENTLWYHEDKIFCVYNIKTDVDGHIWVYYKNIKTLKEYYCYLEAFIARFKLTEQTNHEYIAQHIKSIN